MTDDLGQHPQGAEHPDERSLPALQQVDVDQRLPSGLPVVLDDRGDRIGDVVGRQEVLGEPEFRHLRQLRRCDTRGVQSDAAGRGAAAVDLYWLPLGAGGHFVRLNGRIYEALAAWAQRRPRCDLYHSALQIEVPEATYVIEQTPVPDLSGAARGVVASGAVGSRWAGRFRIFRYEIRVCRGGRIPDVAEAVDSPRRLTEDEACARGVLDVVPKVPTPVWGRDALKTGEMWNSNSVIAWVIARSGIDTESIQPPNGGRAPGWHAGLVVAGRDQGEVGDEGTAVTGADRATPGSVAERGRGSRDFR
jgi:hypothetical protein